MVKKQRYAVFYGEFENEKKKKDKEFWPSGAGIWIFMWSEEPELKSKHASKRDRTLTHFWIQESHLPWKAAD